MKLYYKGQVFHSNIIMADTFMKRLLGLMFKKNSPDYVLVFHPCSSIHTYFMKFNIDVLFLDSDLMVLKKVSDIGKNKMIMPVKKSKYVIEGSSGCFDHIKEGDALSLC